MALLSVPIEPKNVGRKVCSRFWLSQKLTGTCGALFIDCGFNYRITNFFCYAYFRLEAGFPLATMLWKQLIKNLPKRLQCQKHF